MNRNDGKATKKRKQLLDDFKEKKGYLLSIARESTSPPCLENSLWKRLWTCKSDYGITRCRVILKVPFVKQRTGIHYSNKYILSGDFTPASDR
jgi:hypothetical protein